MFIASTLLVAHFSLIPKFYKIFQYFNIRASCFHKLNRSICLKNLSQKIFWFSFLTNCNCIKLLAARLIKCRSCFNNLYSILRPRKTKLIYWTDQAGSNVCDCIGEIGQQFKRGSLLRTESFNECWYPYRRPMSASMLCHVIAFRGRPSR